MESKNLHQEYVVVSPTGNSETWMSDAFWKMAFDPSHVKNKPDMGYLISQFEFEKDWDQWEVHPNGDEVVYCLSGQMTFLLETDECEKSVDLTPGNYVVVPKNTWHTAKVSEPTKALFITWGFGTQAKEK